MKLISCLRFVVNLISKLSNYYDQGCTVKLYTHMGADDETETNKLRIQIRQGDRDDFIDLAEPFSNTAPLNV